MPRKAVIIATSADKLSDSLTGVWLEEVASPYYMFQGDGLDVVIASPKGGVRFFFPLVFFPLSLSFSLVLFFSPCFLHLFPFQKTKQNTQPVPIDEKSRAGDFYTASAKKFDADAEATKKLRESVPVADLVDALLRSSKDEKDDDENNSIAVVFVAGGHGIVADYDDENLTRALDAAAASEKVVVAAVCHGVAALLPVKGGDGKPLLEGKPATCFTNEEEDAVGMTSKMPAKLPSLEDAVKRAAAREGLYSKAAEPWAVCVVAEGRLVTGQNPQSSTGTALAALAALAAAGVKA